MRKAAIIFILLFSAAVLHAQQIQVSGIVTDDQGETVPGVGVIDKNVPGSGTMTDADGRYTIKTAPDSFLEFSSIGYKTVVEHVDGRTEINITLKSASEVLDKVVVIAYGTSKKSDLTGSVSVVDVESISGTPVSSVGQALQGRVAGAEFMSQNGEPGEAGTVQIRGSRSISAGNQPLIVVDGIVDAVQDLGEINPSDIVSISVLKDVSSTAIYGSRGANGVILVTTDNAVSPKTPVNLTFKTSIGLSKIAGKLDIMNASEYAQWRNMCAYQSAGRPDPLTWKPPFPEPESYGKGTDWIDELSQTGVYQDYYLAIKGGIKDNRYSVSVGWNNSKGVVKGAGHRRLSGLFWNDARLTSALRWGIRASYTGQWTDRTTAAIGGTNTSAAIYLSPLLKTDDVWNRYGDSESIGGAVFNNPYLTQEYSTNETEKTAFSIAPWLRAKIKRFTVQTRLSYTYNDALTGTYYPSTLPVAAAEKTGGSASRTDVKQVKLLSETTAEYKLKKRGHDLDVLAGFTAEQQNTDYSSMRGSGYLDDGLTWHNMAGLKDPANLRVTSYDNYKTKLSVLGRTNWSYRRRYYVTATFRADGASNFSEGKKWGLFPALALKWSVSNEPFMSSIYWISDLSFRLSAGRSGNDAVSPYMTIPTLYSAPGDWLFGDGVNLAQIPSRLPNSNLTWEKTDALNAGLSFSVLGDRITLEAEAYLSRTSDLLLSMRTAQTTGFTSYFTNAGATSNAGFEITLNTVNIKRRSFIWSTVFTLSHNSQTVIDAGNGGEAVPLYLNPRNPTQYMYAYKEGYPANALWGYQYEGVWHSEEEVERNEITRKWASSIRPGTKGSNVGRTKYADLNHDGILDENDYVYLGSSDAVVYGGLQNDFKICGRINVGMYWVYSIGGKIYNLSELWMGSGISAYNKYRYMLQAWDPDLRPDSDISRPTFNDTMASDRIVHDASYLRLKTVSVSYDFPVKKRSLVKALNVGICAENLLLLKNYNGFDPDVNSSSSVYRLDNGSYPRPMTAVVNVMIKF